MLRAGDKLRWQRDPQNEYDTNAISLWHQSNQLGHIAANIAAEMAPMLDRGDIDLDVEITAITGGLDGKTNGINIEMVITYKNMKHLGPTQVQGQNDLPFGMNPQDLLSQF